MNGKGEGSADGGQRLCTDFVAGVSCLMQPNLSTEGWTLP